MPELPDVVVYVERLSATICGRVVEDVRLKSPFLVRSAVPPLSSVQGRRVLATSRIGKRIVLELENELFMVFHLMIAGRFKKRPRGAAVPARIGLLALDFDSMSLILTEAGTKKRASLYLVEGREGLAQHNRGGLEVLEASFSAFDTALRRENHTLKRAMTDPRILSGIGNAYSDEILHRAQLSPLKHSTKLTNDEMKRLYNATQTTLHDWTLRLREASKEDFPETVTAFREEMAVHGKYRQPCPVCGTKVQRISYAENETNYCPTCQTEGRLLADRSLSRLLKEDWPKTVDELER